MPDYSYKSGKLNRSHLLHYLDTTFAAVASSPSWYLLGKDVEDASVALNPDTSTKKTTAMSLSSTLTHSMQSPVTHFTKSSRIS